MSWSGSIYCGLVAYVCFWIGVHSERHRKIKEGTPSASHNNKRDVIRYEENHPCSFCDNYSVCKLKINPIPCFRRSELTPIL